MDAAGTRVVMAKGIKVLATLLDVDPGALRMLRLTNKSTCQEKGRWPKLSRQVPGRVPPAREKPRRFV